MTLMSEAFAASRYLTAEDQVYKCDFRQAKLRGTIKQIFAAIKGRSSHLLDVGTITQGKTIRGCQYAGTQSVCIQNIKGSEGRCQDFDQDFNPLKSHNLNRWIGIARAWQCGSYLPAVDLIKVGDIFIVRDGHHRISVARFMGSDFIDAHVTEWVLSD